MLARLLTGAGAAAYVAAWLLPNHYLPWISFHLESLMFLALISLSIVAFKRWNSWVGDALPLLLAALIALIWLQWVTGQIAYHGDAALSTLYLAGAALAWSLGRNAALQDRIDKVLATAAWLTVVAAAASVYVALLQWLHIEDGYANLVVELAPNSRPYGNLAQPNHLASLLLIGGTMTLYLQSRGLIRPWQVLGLFLWFAWGLTMAQSRASWVSVALIGGLLIWRGKPQWRIGSPRAIVAGWGVLTVFGLAWRPLNDALLLGGVFRAPNSTVQDAGRLRMWEQLFQGAAESPWWGYGWHQTSLAQKAGSAYVQGVPTTDYAHCLLIDLGIWVGWPLAIALTYLALRWLWRQVHGIKTADQLLVLCASIPVLVHSMVEFPFAYAYFLFPTAALLGVLGAMSASGSQLRPAFHFTLPKSVLATLLLIFTALSGWATYEYWVVEDDYRVLRFELRHVGQRPPSHQDAQPLLLNQLGEMLHMGRTEPRPGMSNAELARMGMASHAMSWATLDTQYAVALALNGRSAEGSRLLAMMRNYYGEVSYQQAVAQIRRLEKEQYPQLKELTLP